MAAKAVTKNSLNMKVRISKNTVIEIDQTFARMLLAGSYFDFLLLAFKYNSSAVTINSAKHENRCVYLSLKI